jgi:hypothetical protein
VAADENQVGIDDRAFLRFWGPSASWRPSRIKALTLAEAAGMNAFMQKREYANE